MPAGAPSGARISAIMQGDIDRVIAAYQGRIRLARIAGTPRAAAASDRAAHCSLPIRSGRLGPTGSISRSGSDSNRALSFSWSSGDTSTISVAAFSIRGFRAATASAWRGSVKW